MRQNGQQATSGDGEIWGMLVNRRIAARYTQGLPSLQPHNYRTARYSCSGVSAIQLPKTVLDTAFAVQMPAPVDTRRQNMHKLFHYFPIGEHRCHSLLSRPGTLSQHFRFKTSVVVS